MSDDASETPPRDEPMPLSAHLDELRRRVMRALFYAAAGMVVAFVFQDELMAIVLHPVSQILDRHELGALLVSSVAEMFFQAMKVIVVSGIFLSAPFILRELWLFVATGLYPKEKRWVSISAPVSYVLFAAGCLFFYFVIQPIALDFLLTFGTNLKSMTGEQIRLEVMPTIGSTVGFFLSMTLVMGIIFELPLAMLFAQAVGLVDWRTYAQYRRHFIMGAVIFAAVISPTGDAITLGLMMLPITVLFEGGILACRIVAKRGAS